MMQLEDKIAFVTGGSRGIGKAIALEMAREGARVAFTYVANEEAAEETADLITQETGSKPLVLQMEVRDRASVQEALQACVEHFGGLHVLVNNAGVNNPTDFGTGDRRGVTGTRCWT
ncbi:MAG: SDR family NAD(P)-dependent oxidoreductase [Balneolaceae bacterium]|nr:SDR family NAD(P)-dependent oxidoreductase [Balneolaceae bacterium]